MTDAVDTILEQWARERPDLDASPMGVFGRLSRAARLADACLDEVFARHDLDHASFDVLATLRRSGAPHRLTPGELQRSAMVTTSAIAQRLNKLETRGLVRRTPNAVDGRVIDVTLTPAGLDLIDRAVPDHVANEHRMLGGLSARQRAQLVQLLRALTDSMQAGEGS